MKRVLAVRGSPGCMTPEYSLPYEEALRAAGVEPVLIQPGSEIPADLSGLLLLGGTDVNPARYGEARHPRTDKPDDARDDLECALIRDFINHDLPVLAICRGVQMLNVQHGGTLLQHIDRHSVRTADQGSAAHKIEVVPGSRLAAIDGGVWDVNSRHHQAIDRVGEGLVISARDPEDNTIEAVERPDKRFVVGVQWHPENMSATDDRQAKLFRAFAAALVS